VRETITKAIEEKRQAGVVGSSLEARITLRTSKEETRKFLESTRALWPQVAIVSEAAVEFDAGAPELEVKVAKAQGEKCPRCWQWKRDIGADPRHAGVCGRCAAALEAAAGK
jgi:isoleucyl-tRNA synthetase